MIRVLLVSLFLIMSLEARENPFFPAKGEKEMPLTSNSVRTLQPLQRSSIALPSSARVIKKVTIEYENLDASVDTRSIKLNNSVDWHLPLFVSQNIAQTQPAKSAPPPSKSIKKKKQIVKVEKYKKIATTKFVSFYATNKSLKLVTKDKLIRNFLLVQPHRIVLDFKKDASLKSYIKKVPNSAFAKIRVGNHDGYYRAVIELDGQYRYKMKEIAGGYIFTLR